MLYKFKDCFICYLIIKDDISGASPPTYFWLSKGRLCKKIPVFLSQGNLTGPFASKNVTLTLIMSKKNLKCPLSLKPTTVYWDDIRLLDNGTK